MLNLMYHSSWVSVMWWSHPDYINCTNEYPNISLSFLLENIPTSYFYCKITKGELGIIDNDKGLTQVIINWELKEILIPMYDHCMFTSKNNGTYTTLKCIFQKLHTSHLPAGGSLLNSHKTWWCLLSKQYSIAFHTFEVLETQGHREAKVVLSLNKPQAEATNLV